MKNVALIDTPAPFVESLQVQSSDCDFTQSLTLMALQRKMQETAFTHAAQLGLDAGSICGGHYHWVLGRLGVFLDGELPPWRENWEIQTTINGYDRLFAYRNFEFFHQGRSFGRGATSWILIDAESRKLLSPEKAFGCSDEFPNSFRGDGKCDRLRPLESYHWAQEYSVGYRDVDLHNHVNNTRYIAYFLDQFPREHFLCFKPISFQLSFMQELVWGDCIQTGTQELGENSFGHAIKRKDGSYCALGESQWVRK